MHDFANLRPLAPDPDLDQARQYFRLLYGENAPGYLNLCSFGGAPVEWFPANDTDPVAERAIALATSHNVYHSIGLRSSDYYRGLEDPAKERGGSADVTALPGFWLDVDFLDPVHKKTNLPPTPFAALDLLAEFPLKPTLLVDSGHGYQAWYLFQGLWDLASEEERTRAEALLARFQHHMLSRARGHGWTLDNTSDLARVFRVVGSVNWKDADNPLPVRVVAGDATRRYTPEDFEGQLACEPAPEPTARQESRSDFPSNSACPLPDDDALLRRAMTAKDGPKFSRLWAGDLSDFNGDDSAADMSVCDLLAFWTDRDPVRMDRLFRRSALMRPKWDEVRYANGETYGEHTIGEAIAKTPVGYTGAYPSVTNVGCEEHPTCEVDAFTATNAASFEDPHDEIEYLRRALAAERGKNAALSRENDALRGENAALRRDNQTLRSVHSRQWRVFRNPKLKGVGLTAVKLASECAAAVERGRDVDGWIPLTIGGDYGVAADLGKSDKRVGTDIAKLCAWDFFDKRSERRQIEDGPNAGEIRTHLYVRPRKDLDQMLDELGTFGPEQPSWGGKRPPRCQDHPHAGVVRTTAYMCAECGQIIDGPHEQTFGPNGQDVPSGIEDLPPSDCPDTMAASEELLTRATPDSPEWTRCPSENHGPQSPVNIRTLDGRFDRSGASPPDEPPSPTGSTGNPLYDLARSLFPGSYLVEDGFA